MSDYEKWEIAQLIKSGVLDPSEYPGWDEEEGGALANVDAEVRLAAVCGCGRVFIWYARAMHLKRCSERHRDVLSAPAAALQPDVPRFERCARGHRWASSICCCTVLMIALLCAAFLLVSVAFCLAGGGGV
jgi:hypothetical protein